MRRVAALSLAALSVGVSSVTRAQDAVRPDQTATFRADSLRLAGRPWHAAETLLAAARRDPNPNAFLIVEGAKAEVHARRYDRARGLLAGQPWLEAYADGEALAVLGQAEYGLGRYAEAAAHFDLARARAPAGRAPLLAVRAGLAYEAAALTDSAAGAFAAARQNGKLGAIDAWLRVRQARVSRDTAAARELLTDVPLPAARDVPLARARSLLLAADTARALDAFAQAGKGLEVARLALAAGDSARARAALYELLARAPQSDDAAAAVPLAQGPLSPRAPNEYVALARALNRRTTANDARINVERALRRGDSSASTLLFYGEVLVAMGRFREAERVYRAAARDSVLGPLAIYRRARVLVRLGDPGASAALSGFAQTYPADTAAPGALYTLADMLDGRGDWGGGSTGAPRWYAELIARYPSDYRASLARFRLAARAESEGRLDSATALYQAEIDAAGPQRTGARFWLGKMALARGDSSEAWAIWVALAREDSLGYYGVRARRETGLPPLSFAPALAPLAPPPPAVVAGLARIDTLLLAGLDSEAQAEVRVALARPPQELDVLLAWSEGLGLRGYGSAAVRLGWQAALQAPGDPRVLRAIFPWPNRIAVEAEADEFGVDALLLAALVRQESVFDVEALSPAGARGLAQLLPSTAALTARGLDVIFYPAWITVPDLNLHLGAAHLAELLKRFGRIDAAVAAYNAGPSPVRRWLERAGARDPDRFIELIPYPETRGYVRSVLRNRELYRALYGAPEASPAPPTH
ncbi:MAG TPA: transglycosylase SLT domain-containing protein [Gemmatimonadales bacterium]|nr:transglycosylase SLT domain-containing protein [Gemmatimonadales bacterium]